MTQQNWNQNPNQAPAWNSAPPMQQPMQDPQGIAYDWDGIIEKDPSEFITLKPGNYEFVVVEAERGQYEPGPNSKLPACKMVTVHVEVVDPETRDTVRLKSNIYLHSITEGLISAFFASIGLKKKGEPLRMDWSRVVGGRGMCKVGNRTHKDTTYNDLKSFLPPADYDQPQAAQQQQAWKPGGY